MNTSVRIGFSPIHGRGIMATRNLAPGQYLSLEDIFIIRQIGLNHSCFPNVERTRWYNRWPRRCKHKIIIIVADILAGQELTFPYLHRRTKGGYDRAYGEPCLCNPCRLGRLIQR